MTSSPHRHDAEHSVQLCMYAMKALPPVDVPLVETRIAGCAHCQEQLASLRPLLDCFASWPTDVLRPPASLWDRLADRVGADTGAVASPTAGAWTEPDWEEVAPGISVKMLASDAERERVSMLVRLEPGVEYPPHIHGGLEELHLLHGELWINDCKLHPGDYNRAEAGTADRRVWSETGCTCVLVTSPRDILR